MKLLGRAVGIMVLVIYAEPRIDQWTRDLTRSDTEFLSFFSNTTVRRLGECLLSCTTVSECNFVTFTSTTRQCKMYFILENPIQVTNASLWKPSLQCVTLDSGQKLTLFPNIEVRFDQANSICVIHGGQLLKVNTTDSLQQLGSLVKQTSELKSVKFWWVGGRKTTNDWQWLDGQPMNTTDGPYFYASGNGNCIRYMSITKRLDDFPCYKTISFICEFDRCN